MWSPVLEMEISGKSESSIHFQCFANPSIYWLLSHGLGMLSVFMEGFRRNLLWNRTFRLARLYKKKYDKTNLFRCLKRFRLWEIFWKVLSVYYITPEKLQSRKKSWLDLKCRDDKSRDLNSEPIFTNSALRAELV